MRRVLLKIAALRPALRMQGGSSDIVEMSWRAPVILTAKLTELRAKHVLLFDA